MITTIAEHQIDLDLLPVGAKILDLGCRGFLFANELKRLGHNVLCVDMDSLEGGEYLQFAVVGDLHDSGGYVPIERSPDPQATRIKQGHKIDNNEWVKSITISKILRTYFSGKPIDCIKMDIEGGEWEVIMMLKKAPAKQLSIEFHLHTGVYGTNEMTEMVTKLESLGYEAASHELTKQHGLGLNYWDSLFILK